MKSDDRPFFVFHPSSFLGIAIGVACKWMFSFLYFRCVGKPTR
jgi:hypothetical protein